MEKLKDLLSKYESEMAHLESTRNRHYRNANPVGYCFSTATMRENEMKRSDEAQAKLLALSKICVDIREALQEYEQVKH